MTSSSFDSSKVVPCESTPLDRVSSGGGPVPQAKKKSRSFVHVVATILLVFLAVTVNTRLSSSASPSSIVDQSVSKSENKVIENDSIVFPTASLAASETKTSLRQVDEEVVSTSTDLSFTPSTYYLAFPPGVYDSTTNNIDGIGKKCNNFLTRREPTTDHEKARYVEQTLACHIYQDVDHQIVLGTIKLDADIVKISATGTFFPNTDVSTLFVDYALAAMIDRGCFVYQTSDAYDTDYASYFSKNSYQNEMSKSGSIDVSSSASYLGVTASAGYQHSHSASSSSSGTTASAYGRSFYRARMGKLKNRCFESQSRFNKNIKDLVLPKWVQCWTAMRIRGQYPTTVKDLTSLGCFPSVADGGFYMPVQYYYDIGVETVISTSYTEGSSEEETTASSVISAGLDVSIGKVGGSLESNVKEATKSAQGSKSLSSAVKVTTHSNFLKAAGGKFPGTTCTAAATNAVVTCGRMISLVVDYIRSDYTQLPPPTSLGKVDQMKSLDQIIGLYFGTNYGLPDAFLPAYNTYGYNRLGKVCWGYDFDSVAYQRSNPKIPMENKHNCWTTNKNIVPTGINTGTVSDMSFWGAIVSPHPTSCCNQCESTYFCDANCQELLGVYSTQLANNFFSGPSLFAPLVHNACLVDPYNRPGAVCWGYDMSQDTWTDKGVKIYDNYNVHQCWTTHENNVPTGIGLPDFRTKYQGGIISPKYKSCCNQCESTYQCDSPSTCKNYDNIRHYTRTLNRGGGAGRLVNWGAQCDNRYGLFPFARKG